MKLNLGCGKNRVEGFVNVDFDPHVKPDMELDLEDPWPFDANSVDYILATHIVEHMSYLRDFFENAYRVMQPGTLLDITVPHHRSDTFFDDPTHVSPVTETMMHMLSLKFNAMCEEKKYSNTPLAEYWGVDFELVTVENALNEGWKDKPREEILHAVNTYNNVVSQVRFVLKAIKP